MIQVLQYKKFILIPMMLQQVQYDVTQKNKVYLLHIFRHVLIYTSTYSYLMDRFVLIGKIFLASGVRLRYHAYPYFIRRNVIYG